MKYVSPEYNDRLKQLAETLCTPERFGKIGEVALQGTLFDDSELAVVIPFPTPPEDTVA